MNVVQPNIVFIFADDWGWGDLACHGHPVIRTPVLDRLAAEGTDFQDFTVNNPVCSPSRTALITGQYPARHHVHRHFATHEHNAARGMPDWLDPTVTTLPSLMKTAGYRTAHYGKWHLTSDAVTGAPLPEEYGYDDAAVFNGPGKRIWEGLEKPEEAEAYPHAYKTIGAVEHALRFIESNKDRPFYINLWIQETHSVVEATPAQKQAYADLPDVKEPELTYYAAVTRADSQIGRVLDRLKELELEERTLIVFSSDNGPEVPKEDPVHITHFSRGSTGGLKGHKRSLYDGGVRVPFLARWTGRIPAGHVNGATSLSAIDMLPTLCALAGISLPSGYEPDGENMLAALLGSGETRSKALFWEWRGPEKGHNWPRLGIRDGEWKLVMNDEMTRIELYHKDDWKQEHDVYAELPELALDMRERLLVWMAGLPPYDRRAPGSPTL